MCHCSEVDPCTSVFDFEWIAYFGIIYYIQLLPSMSHEMRFVRRIPFLVFSGILIGYIILLPPEIIFV